MVMKMLDIADALVQSEATEPTARPRRETAYKYTRSMDDYQALLPMWREKQEGGTA